MQIEKFQRKFSEVKIKVPWGHLAGKWYNSASEKRPILCIHGWLDNANTFDRLINLLPEDIGFLTIDLPGHGLSSWFPDGMYYHFLDFVNIINFIMLELRWTKVAIIGHSLGSLIAFVFAGLYPDKVEMFIGLDALYPLIDSPENHLNFNAIRVEKFLEVDHLIRNSNTEPPSYSWENLINIMIRGSNDSLTKESAIYLVKRNVSKSYKFPDKFYFHRDNRTKFYYLHNFDFDNVQVVAKRIIAPQLYVRAIGPNSVYYYQPEYMPKIIDILSERDNFEYFEVPGTHHVHLNDPEKINLKIMDFISKYYVSSNKKSKL